LGTQCIKKQVLYDLGRIFLRKQNRPEGNNSIPNQKQYGKKANAANSARQKQANVNRSKQAQADNSKK
jgi:hypothetical protein